MGKRVVMLVLQNMGKSKYFFKNGPLMSIYTDRFIGDRISAKKQRLKRSRTTAGLGCN
jgi:hypothetical protein